MTTFEPVHGAHQGGWIWAPVAERLVGPMAQPAAGPGAGKGAA